MDQKCNFVEISSFSSFNYYDENDDYLYHVTSEPAALKICEFGFDKVRDRMFGKSYDGHSEGRVFFTEKSGVKFWSSRVEDRLFDAFDEPPEVAVVRVSKAHVKDILHPDDIGTQDARHDAFWVSLKDIKSSFKEFGRVQAVGSNPDLVGEHNWLSKSALKNEDGSGVTLYHGTIANFTEFDTSDGWYGRGIYFTNNPASAEEFALDVADDNGYGVNIIPCFLNLENPFVFSPSDHSCSSQVELLRTLGLVSVKANDLLKKGNCSEKITELLQKKGYDGLIVIDANEGNEYIAFDASQVKFSIARNWNYNIEDRAIVGQPQKYFRPR